MAFDRSLLQLVTFMGVLMGAELQAIPGWDLVWSDEFSQADGSAPDPTKWSYDIGGGGWGNNEIQYYTDRTENARIEGGQLLIEAREENFGNRNHTSARLLTKGKWDWTYGRFEARIKVPAGTGLWPAFWMLGADIDAVGWPNCGEIDIMEFVGREPKEVFATIHGPGYSGGASFGSAYSFIPDVSDDYHDFVVEWDENQIRWFVDGINYHNATPANLGGNSWVFDHDHFLLLNLAIGGDFGGSLDPNLSFPRQLWVDYVRVYRRKVPNGMNVLVNPGLEAGSLGAWRGYAPGGANDEGAYVESTNSTYYNGGNPGGDNVLTHSGQYVGKVFGDFAGGENFNGFYQEVNADSGSIWSASAYLLTHPQDLMTGGNTTWIGVSFRDESDSVLSLFRTPVLTSANVAAGSWMKVEVSEELDPVTRLSLGTASAMEAPAGTVKIRYEVVYRQPGFDGGSMYFDDLSLIREASSPLQAPELSLRRGMVVSWTAANATSTYQPESSPDGVNWSPLGPPLNGNAVSSAFDSTEAPNYRVVETIAGGPSNAISNPGFETAEPAIHPSPGAVDWAIAAPEDTNPANGDASMTAESSYSIYGPHSGSRMLVIESTTPVSPAPVSPPNTDVRSDFIAVDANTNYDLSFYAAHVVKEGGANPQFNLRFYNAGMNEIGSTGFESFMSIGSVWTQVEKNFTTPAGTSWMTISWIQALGGVNGWHWVTLIDDVDLPTGNSPGGQAFLPAAVAAGIELSWMTEIGSSYQVEFSNKLGGYKKSGILVLGNGNVATVTDVFSEARRFYRVVRRMLP